MDPEQPQQDNPFGMDDSCTNCSLCASRRTVVHGYGDTTAEFLFVLERPTPAADRNEGRLTGPDGDRLREILEQLGFIGEGEENGAPVLENAYLTHLTRCRNPDRGPRSEEIDACEPFLDAEIRMINPELIVPIGDRVLKALATEYTTASPESFDIDAVHATTVRGRGFELLPMRSIDRLSQAEMAAFVEHVAENVFGRDYRQTKGRQRR